jgi:hypothetical protein
VVEVGRDRQKEILPEAMEGSVKTMVKVMGDERLCVYECIECGEPKFSRYPFWQLTPKEKSCSVCQGVLRQIGDTECPELFPNVRYKYSSYLKMRIAYFAKRCPNCKTGQYIPWIDGRINYDYCPRCLELADREYIKCVQAFEYQDKLREGLEDDATSKM